MFVHMGFVMHLILCMLLVLKHLTGPRLYVQRSSNQEDVQVTNLAGARSECEGRESACNSQVRAQSEVLSKEKVLSKKMVPLKTKAHRTNTEHK